MTLSAATITTRRQRPARIQSSAKRDGLGGAGAGGVDLCVRAARADDLGELRVTHRQDSEQEPPVELERLGLEHGLDLADRGGRSRPRPRRRRRRDRIARKCGELLPAGPVGDVALDVGGELAEPGEGRGEDHAGVVAQRVGQTPPLGQLASRPWSSCSAARAGCPASRSASKPAPIASRVQSSSALSRSASTPNSSTRSNAPARAASLMTSSALSIASNRGAVRRS